MLLIDNNGLVVAKSETITHEKDGYLVEDTTYPYSLNLILVDLIAPEYVSPQNYRYERGEFVCVAKEKALQRIDGKCSGAIFGGVTLADKHYSLSLVTQQNLKTAQDKITAGATSVIFAADGEEPTVHTAEQITAISNAAYEWGVVNTSYYAKLQKWIVRETDTAVLNAIDYGSMLPNDLMTELATLLAGAGIDLAKYSTMLGG